MGCTFSSLSVRASLRFAVAFVTTAGENESSWCKSRRKKNNRKIYDDDIFMDSVE